MIKAIFFDLDDTLLWDKQSIKTAFEATCEYAAEKENLDPAALEKAVREKAAELYASYEFYPFTKMIGINPFEGLWGTFPDPGEDFEKMKEMAPRYRKEAWIKGLKEIGIDNEQLGEELAERFPAERRKRPFLFEETLDVLDQLKDKYKLLLLTNGSPDLQHTKLDISPELTPYFDQIIISGSFGRGKPDPSIFEHALERMDLKKEEAVMVGDNLMTDILGASRAGIASIWVNREKKERNEVVPDYEIGHLSELFPILKQL